MSAGGKTRDEIVQGSGTAREKEDGRGERNSGRKECVQTDSAVACGVGGKGWMERQNMGAGGLAGLDWTGLTLTEG